MVYGDVVYSDRGYSDVVYRDRGYSDRSFLFWRFPTVTVVPNSDRSLRERG